MDKDWEKVEEAYSAVCDRAMVEFEKNWKTHKKDMFVELCYQTHNNKALMSEIFGKSMCDLLSLTHQQGVLMGLFDCCLNGENDES